MTTISFESELDRIGKDGEQALNEALNHGVLNFAKSISAFFIGIKEIGSYEVTKSKRRIYKNLIGLVLVICLTGVLFALSSRLGGMVYEYLQTMKLFKWVTPLFSIRIVQGIGILIVMSYITSIGFKFIRMKEDFKFQFEQMGLVTRGQDRYSPVLKKVIRGKKGMYYIFGSKGIPLKNWQQKYDDICQMFNDEVFEIACTANNRNIIRVTILDPEERTRLEEKEERQREVDTMFENAGIYPKVTKEVLKNGVITKTKDYPKLISEKEDELKVVYKFKSIGTSLDQWKDAWEMLQNGLNKPIMVIKYEKKNKQIFIIEAALKDLKESYLWKDSYLPEKPSEYALGMGYLGVVSLDLNSTPHALVGGLTGSGKTVLVRAIAWQSVIKGDLPFFIDFKGGLGFNMFSPFGQVLSEIDKVVDLLKALKREHESRISLFKKTGVDDMKSYNKTVREDEQLRRVIVYVDEAAEMLEQSGLSKEEKEKMMKLEGLLNTFARLYRASGINLIMGTQRPDAKVIKGQIRSNLGARISGRMSEPKTSEMVLGSSDATRIPSDIRGRMMYSIGADPITFQGFLFEKEMMKLKDYRKGIVLELHHFEVAPPVEKVKKEKPEKETVNLNKEDLKADYESSGEPHDDIQDEEDFEEETVSVEDPTEWEDADDGFNNTIYEE